MARIVATTVRIGLEPGVQHLLFRHVQLAVKNIKSMLSRPTKCNSRCRVCADQNLRILCSVRSFLISSVRHRLESFGIFWMHLLKSSAVLLKPQEQQTWACARRLQDVRATEADKVEIYGSFRPGDLVRAEVLSLGDTRSYYLSTARNELGVVYAKSVEGVVLAVQHTVDLVMV